MSRYLECKEMDCYCYSDKNCQYEKECIKNTLGKDVTMKIYYAHFIGIYNTKQEERDLQLLKTIFEDAQIVNPNNPENEQLYKEKGMDLFFKMIEDCSLLIFRGTISGKIPAGVLKEINYAKEKGIPVLEIPSFINREMSVDETRLTLIELGIR